MRYLIRPDRCIHPVDVPASVLWLATRGGPVTGDAERQWRDELAGLVGPGLLAELLRSDRPIRVTSKRADVWVVESVD